MEFQSEKYYFFDKLQKQEIRVRNGNTYFYEEVGLCSVYNKKTISRNYVKHELCNCYQLEFVCYVHMNG